MIYPPNFEEIIGFDSLRRELGNLCRLDSSAHIAAEFNMHSSMDSVQVDLNDLDECKRINELFPSLFHWVQVTDIEPWLKYVDVEGYFLSEDEFSGILEVLHLYAKFSNTLKNRAEEFPLFFKRFSANDAVLPTINLIESVVDREGKLRTNASVAYQKLTQEIARLDREARIQTHSIFKAWKAQGYVADTDVTVREERLVIPILAEFKRKVQGFVKDVSATGKVLFVEPAAILEINNRLKELFSERKRERERILKQLTAQLSPKTHQLLHLMDSVTQADFVYAKWLLCDRYRAERPRISSKSKISLKKAFHPVLHRELSAQNKQVVPLQIEMDEKRVVVVSGPNAGGKSVVLKTTLLLQYWLQCGFFISASPDSEMGFFSNLAIDSGDGQSLESGLSTFSAHLKNLKAILEMADETTLVGLDELGTGTDPRYGAPIAQAVLEELLKKSSFVIATTHFSQIREWGRGIPNVVQASMQYDALHLKPLYTFVMGKPGSSFALELMRKTGFDGNWMNTIERLSGESLGKTEDLMLDLERQNQQLLQQIQENEKRTQHLNSLIAEYTELKDKINSKRQAILEQTRVEAKQLLSTANQQIEQTIRIIRENSADKIKTHKAREKLDTFKVGLEKRVGQKIQSAPASPEKSKEEKVVKLDPKTIIPGAKVKNRISGQTGEVLEVKKEKVLVVFGLIKMWVPLTELQVSVEKSGGSKQRTTSGFNWVERQSVFSDTLDLHGVQPDASLEVIAKWLGEGYALGRRELKIVHGKGTGVLRRTVRNHLKTMNFVKSYHSEDKFNGGDGCTIVVLN